MNCICGKEANPEIGACEKHFELDPESFQGQMLKGNLTIKQVSDITGTPRSTVESWVYGDREAPKIAFWALGQLAR